MITILEQSNVREEMPNRIRGRIVPRAISAVLSSLACLVFLGSGPEARAGFLKPDVDLSHTDVPLYEQIRNHISAKILARLGEGKSERDRYFIVPFAYQNKGNDPRLSHSFLSVIRVLSDDGQRRLTPGVEKREYKNREFEAFTISWLPADFVANPDLCVFEGMGSRMFAKRNRCRPVVGHSFDLAATIQLGVDAKNAVGMWGPYEITKDGFDLAVKRMRLLNEGSIQYCADDRLYRKDRVAINCFHAIAGLDKLFPNGGLFGSGFKMWGIDGTARVLIEYKTRAAKTGALLEPVDIKKDLYGFVYAPARSGHGIYNPFRNASAYRGAR